MNDKVYENGNYVNNVNISHASFLNFNINGLLQKLDNNDLMQFITSYDFICLTETFIAFDFESNVFSDYMIFTSKAKKLSSHGRYSGGVIAMVNKKYKDLVHHIPSNVNNVIMLQIDKQLFGTDKNVMWVCAYVPPYDSAFWKSCEDGYGIELLEQCILDIQSSQDECFLLLSGDLNARTASENYCFAGDESDFLVSESLESKFPRISQDMQLNCFGEQLLEFCNMFDCLILNGLCDHAFDDSCTFISSAGCSTVDYFIMSCELFSSLKVASLEVENITESDHLPVSLGVEISKYGNTDNRGQTKSQERKCMRKLRWNKDKESEFIANLKSSNIQQKLETAMVKLDDNVDDALDLFVTCIKEASACMYKKVSVHTVRKSEWFDEECQLAKKESRRKLNQFRVSRLENDRKDYVIARKFYKSLLKKKKQEFRKQKVTQLASNISDSSIFWKELRSMGCSKNDNSVKANIEISEWYDHFKTVFQSDDEPQDDRSNVDISKELLEESDHVLNEDLTEEEVKKAINRLKVDKATGIDGISAEMIKTGGDAVLCFLTKLFNTLFSKGLYPKEWSKAIIIPIYKKGDPENTDNYRGVSLLSIVSKCYTTILNTRLYSWLEDNDMLSDSQAGFRRNYSTVDQIFNLYSIVQKCLNKKGRKLYTAFIDFKKAFDSVRHNKLLDYIKNQGVRGKFFSSLKAMYNSLVSCIRANCEFSEFFDCPVGVRQGCVLSPTLFSVFINQLADHMNEKGKHGIQLLPGIMELFILLFADDVVLFSTSPAGLQNQLNILKTCCDSMKLSVNINKTKVMVFRKGGFLGKHENWHYDGMKLEVVNRYCYLGFNFTTKLSPKLGTEHLVVKGKKAAMQLNRVYQKYKEMTPEVFFKIFDSKIQPILLYSSEIWGLYKLEHLEKVHLLACKRFLGVPLKTPNKMIYGDLGRYPLYINSSVNCLRYWFKLLEMDNKRITYSAYQMLLDSDKDGKYCWVSKIREILCETGFSFVWLQQGVGDTKHFLQIFRQRLVDMFIQEWSGTIRDRERYDAYRTFKTVFEKEKYISDIEIYCFRVAISQIRFNVLPLNNNIYRYSEVVQKKNCPFCKTVLETEHHFLYQCSMYDDLRQNFFGDNVCESTNVLLKANNNVTRHGLSRFVFHAIKKRKELTN